MTSPRTIRPTVPPPPRSMGSSTRRRSQLSPSRWASSSALSRWPSARTTHRRPDGARAAALQRHARDPDARRHRVLASADDGLPRAADVPGGVRHQHSLGDLGAHGLPGLGRGHDPYSRPPRRPVRQGAAAARQPRALPRGVHRRRGGVEHLVADRLPDPLRRRRRALPAQLRDHPGRVPAGAGEGGDRPALGRVRRRRRTRDRPLGPHRRPRLLALALHPRLDPGGGLAPARPSLRPRVARALALAGGLPGSAPARGWLDLADARAHRGRELGLGVARDPGARGGIGRPLRALGDRRAALEPRRWWTCGCSRIDPCC